MNCRHCQTPLQHTFLDLGFAPPSNAYLTEQALQLPERYYPLRLFVCDHCWLVQTEDYAEADELFCPDYAYFSSVSKSWCEHAARYSAMITQRLGLNEQSMVIEVASNDGYLLKNFVAAGIPCLGIEPTSSTAAAAKRLGIPVVEDFFTQSLAAKLISEEQQADLIIGNNVFAHVPDINDFTAALEQSLKPGGTVTLEFPHLMRLIAQTQFDTVYHEHFSYLSLTAVSRIFESAGLRLFDVEELPTHGGSLRIYGCRADDPRPSKTSVVQLLHREDTFGLRTLSLYQEFQEHADRVKNELLLFLINQKCAGKKVAAYGAAAKGCTLLNYAGVKPDLLPFVCDAAPSKQGKFLPGTHIPILAPATMREAKPDIVLLLPWNIRHELTMQLDYVREWGAHFAVVVPQVEVW